MVYAVIALSILVVILLWVLGDREMKNRKEIEFRDRHLEWVDRRDVLLSALFTKVSEARVVPMTNPLDGMKQHGMLTKNAVTPFYLNEMDERLTYTQGFLKRAIAAAKEIEHWEARNPAPPVRPGEEREANVGSPMPLGVPAHDQFVDDPDNRINTSPLPASFAEPKAVGKGAFGPEVDEPGGAPHGAPQAAEVEQSVPQEVGVEDRDYEIPRRRVRDNPQA